MHLGTIPTYLQQRLSALHTTYRRHRLIAAYASVFEHRTGKHVGFTPLIHAYTELENDGLIEITDGELIWNWPDETEPPEPPS